MMTTAEKYNVQTLAEDLMEEHLNRDIKMYGDGCLWRFKWDTAKRRYGQCSSSKCIIGLSAVANAGRDMDWIKNTILHEIAHALVGPGHGHGSVWKAKAVELGVRPRSTTKFVGDVSRQAEYKWFLIHKETGKVYQGQFKLSRQRQNRECSDTAYLCTLKRETKGNLMYVDANHYWSMFGRAPEVC